MQQFGRNNCAQINLVILAIIFEFGMTLFLRKNCHPIDLYDWVNPDFYGDISEEICGTPV